MKHSRGLLLELQEPHMKKFTFVLFGAIASAALAHPGPRVWIGNEGNQLITYQKSGTDYVHEQVFSQPLENILDNIWTTDFPGYFTDPDGHTWEVLFDGE